MFKKRTLFILGAGASHEFGLPLGPVLASSISQNTVINVERNEIKKTAGADLLDQIHSKAGSNVGEFYKAFALIRYGVQLASSIDDFLDVHASNKFAQRVGKMAIVKTILLSERNSSLHVDKSNTYNKLVVNNFENTWIVKFMRMLVRGVPMEKRHEIFENVSFIIFNYDRCVEHFLMHALRQFYAISDGEAAKILANLTIIRPYGSVAPLKLKDGDQGYYYGASSHGFDPDYWTLSQGVRTYTEQITDEAELDKIHKEMLKARRIVFLGFGFHDQNLRLLMPPDGLGQVEIFATAKGMSDSDVTLVKDQLVRFYQPPYMHMVGAGASMQIRSDLTCAQLFDSYNKSLPA